MTSAQKLKEILPDSDLARKFLIWIDKLPEPWTLSEHSGQDGRTDSCCQLASFQLQKLAEAASARNGITCVLKSAHTYYEWGSQRPTHICEAVENRLCLDYGPMSSLLMRQFSHCKEVIEGSVTPIPIGILAIAREDERELWRQKFDNQCDDWMFESVFYRQCIGFLANTTGRLSIWNYDHWLILGDNSMAAENDILAWRFGAADRDMTFDGLRIPKSMTNQWLTTKPAMLTNLLNRQSIGLRETPDGATEKPTVFISGTSMNGDNPCPGVGTARSLRIAFDRSVTLIGVENSCDSAGLHDPSFDDIIVLASAQKSSPRDHFDSVCRLLESHPNSFYLPVEDIEVRMLSQQLGDRKEDICKRILVPSKSALRRVTKPRMEIGEQYFPDFCIPPYIEQETGESDDAFALRAQPFLHACSFPVFVKSMYNGAIPATDFAEVKSAVRRLHAHWDKPIYVQEAKCGFEETIMFAAYDGKLLGDDGNFVVLMRKAMITHKGKAWAAALSCDLSDEFIKRLTDAVRELKWTGGGEIEYVRTLDDRKYLIDWNLRFPGWVYGASQGTLNLPAALVSTAFEQVFGIRLPFEQPELRKGAVTGFVRTISEIPWSQKIGRVIMRGPEFLSSNIFGEPTGPLAIERCKQHPSRQAHMARLLQKLDDQPDMCGNSIPNSNTKDILPSVEETFKLPATPCRYVNTTVLREKLTQFKEIIDRAVKNGSNGKIASLVALSIKTQPEPAVLKAAIECGYVADAIALPELDLALKYGFKTEQLIMNGPCKFWRRDSKKPYENGLPASIHQFLAVFADSVTELENFPDEVINHGGVIGIRLAMPGTGTRFGLDISDMEAIDRLTKVLNRLPEGVEIGFHFHYASSDIGLKVWFDLCRIFVSACRSIMSMSGCQCPLTMLDFGGGFVPITDDLREQFELDLTKLFAEVAAEFPSLKRMVIEPGKCVLIEATSVITRVVEIREPVLYQKQTAARARGGDKGPMRAIVVDACIGDARLAGQARFHNQLPGSSQYHRNAYSLSSNSEKRGEWKMIPKDGQDIVLGRLCMEIDMLLTGATLPADLKVGDYLALTNGGAYEAAAAFAFGEGHYNGPVYVDGSSE